MEKKENIAKNTSSGAEKVEKVVEKKKTPAKKTTKKPSAKKSVVKKRIEREKARAKRREEIALKREERKKRIALKKQERKAKKEARKAELRAKREALKKESKAERAERRARERAKRLALKEKEKARRKEIALQKKDARLKQKEKKMQEKSERKQRRTPGFGGWLAAVVSLGAACLALTAIVTYETMGMRRADKMMQAGYTATMYEFIGNFDEMDNDLNKARVSAGKEEQTKLLTDVLVETRLAEMALERLPFSFEQDERLTAFINRTGNTAQRLINKISQGEPLSQKDLEKIEELYQKCHKIRASLDTMAMEMEGKDMCDLMKNKEKSRIRKTFKDMENMAKEGDYESPLPPQPREDKITTSQAEELMHSYFADYDLKTVEYAGETLAKGYTAYNFICHDKDGKRLYAEIASDGSLVGFDYFENCTKQNFDMERSTMIAQDFLAKLGYESMEVVFATESGAEAEFKFAYNFQGAICYADTVRVKVCEERGIVVGLDASKYLRHHKNREEWTATISLEEAQNGLSDKLSVLSSNVAILPHHGREVPAYEFICEYDGNEYYVYVSAQTGREIAIYLVEATAQGRFMR